MIKYILFMAVVALAQTVSADPCSVLDQWECQSQSTYCVYEAPTQTTAGCFTRPGGSSPGNCNQIHSYYHSGIFKRDQAMGQCNSIARFGCYWSDGEYKPGGCYLRPRIKSCVSGGRRRGPR